MKFLITDTFADSLVRLAAIVSCMTIWIGRRMRVWFGEDPHTSGMRRTGLS